MSYDTETLNMLALNMVEGLGPITIRRLLDAFKSAGAVLRASRDLLRRVDGIGPELAERISRWKESIDPVAEMARAGKLSLNIVTRADPAYPPLLKEIYDPPTVLYLKGTLRTTDRHAVAIVGARNCTHYGRVCAERLAAQVARMGITVVSGLARGIDTAAHRGALTAGGRTIAVLGSGLDRVYPRENKRLAEMIASSGAVISEFPLATGPHRRNFPLRNRVISGLSVGVIVVEAARRSGSLVTAAQALEQGRSVFAVPGRIDSYLSQGTHALIKQGAKLMESVDDLIDDLPYLFAGTAGARVDTTDDAPPRPKLTPSEKQVFANLTNEERPIDEIVAASGLPPAQVAAALLSLELKRCAEQLPGKLFRRKMPL